MNPVYPPPSFINYQHKCYGIFCTKPSRPKQSPIPRSKQTFLQLFRMLMVGNCQLSPSPRISLSLRKLPCPISCSLSKCSLNSIMVNDPLPQIRTSLKHLVQALELPLGFAGAFVPQTSQFNFSLCPTLLPSNQSLIPGERTYIYQSTLRFVYHIGKSPRT